MKIKKYVAVLPITNYITLGIEGMSPGFSQKVKFSWSNAGVQDRSHTAKLLVDKNGRVYFNSYKVPYYLDEFSKLEDLWEAHCNDKQDNR